MHLISAFTSDTDKALWHLVALPMIFSNITVPLLGLVDTAMISHLDIGHLDSPIYFGGVAIGTMVSNFLFMLLLFLRMSTTGLAAQALGAQSQQRLARALCSHFYWHSTSIGTIDRVWQWCCCAIR